MSSKAMSKRVRRNILDSYLLRSTFDHGPCKESRKLFATIKKDIRRRLISITSFYRCILLQPVNRTLSEWYTPFLAAFAVTDNQTRHQINIGLFQADHF